jgi:hypothetical protein
MVESHFPEKQKEESTMFRILFTCWVGLFWVAMAVEEETPAVKPDPLPPGIPATMGSMYQLMFELDKGLPYRDFIRAVPHIGAAREPKDILNACQHLGLKAKHFQGEWNDLVEMKGPFLARIKKGDWLLYRLVDGRLQRLDQGKETIIIVAETDFLNSWTGDVIAAAKPTKEDLEKAPRVQFVETEHDFGDVWQGEKVEHSFVFKNVGSGTLEITDVRAGCACTAVLVSREGTGDSGDAPRSAEAENRFRPGESGYIKVVLNTAGKRHQTESSVAAHTNDPLNPVVALRVKANVRIAVEVTPSQAYFGRVSKGSSLTREIRIRTTEEPAFEILEATSSNPHVQFDLARLDPVAGDESTTSYLLKISLDIEGMAYGEEIKDAIVLKTTSKQRPSIEIRVDAMVTGDVFLAPTTLRFAPLYPKGEMIRYLILRNNGQDDVDILEVKSEIPGLSFETQTLSPGKQYRIKVTLRVDETPQPVEGEVVVVTSHPEQSELRVGVTSASPGSPNGSGDSP